MKLEKLNLVELNEQELKSIEGGNFLKRVWNWIKSRFSPREGGVDFEVFRIELN